MNDSARQQNLRPGQKAALIVTVSILVGVVSFAASFVTSYRERNLDTRQAVGEFASTLKEAVGNNVPAGLATPQVASPAASPPGSEAAFVRGATAITKRSANDTRVLRSQMDAIDLGSFLSATTLTNPARILKARQGIEDYKRLVDQQYARSNAYYAEMETYLRTTRAPGTLAQDALGGFLKASAVSKAAYQEWRDAEFAVASSVMDILDFAGSRQKTMKLQGNAISFSSGVDGKRYNQLQNALRDTAAREDAVVRRLGQLESDTRANAEQLSALASGKK
ncbi:hypothetical protein [Variovorax rhizosphaerae]|uniref:Uncharacterized protein n=1 Tax=Variovorax rhizosphaerae TaxID=1836200 RepID=A0ABU8WZ90_9BURK